MALDLRILSGPEASTRSPRTGMPHPEQPHVIALEAGAAGTHRYRALPSGMFGLTFHCGSDLRLHRGESSESRPSAVVPVRATYRDMSLSGWGRLVVAFLTPMHLVALADDFAPLREADQLSASWLLGRDEARRIEQALARTGSSSHATTVVRRAIEDRMTRRRAKPAGAWRSARIALQMLKEPSLSLESLAGIEGVSRRQMTRDFACHLGLHPKAYSSVARVQGAALAIAQGQAAAATALQFGFCDQPHLANALRRVTGLSTGQIRTQSRSSACLRLQEALPGYLVAV